MYNNLPMIIKKIIKNEYAIRAEILSNICNHIDLLNRDNIIHHIIRSKMINNVNNCIMTLNVNYNDSLPLYKNIVYTPSDTELSFIINGNYEAYKLFNSIGINNFNKLRIKVIDFYKDTDIMIYELMNMIGSKSMSDLFKLKLGDNYREILNIDSDLTDLKQYVQENKKNFNLH